MEREENIASLRALADLLESHPELKMPHMIDSVNVFTYEVEDLRAWARAMGTSEKEYGDDDRSFNFKLYGEICGMSAVIYGSREGVCTKRIMGTVEEVITERDPNYMAKVPMITHTVVREIVEWDCGSLLAEPEMAEAND